MRLTDKEKQSIFNLKPDDSLKFEDYDRSVYQYEVSKVSQKEWSVSKWAIFCLRSTYFMSPVEVIEWIEN